MMVVADSTPLIALARVGRLELLCDVFGRVIIPDAVWRETVEDSRGRTGASEISAAAWIERRALGAAAPLAEHLRQTLGDGESEAIALAQELHADVLLMDEKLGRAAARGLGLRVTGLIGVLIEAKKSGILPDAVPLARAIRAAGVWIGDDLIDLLRQS